MIGRSQGPAQAGPAPQEAWTARPPDPLSEALAALHVDSSVLHVFDFQAPWEIALGDVPVAISWTVMQGIVWLHQDDRRIALHRGDTVLLCRGGPRNVVISDAQEAPPHAPTRAQDLFQGIAPHGTASADRGEPPRRVRWGGQGALTRVVSVAYGWSDQRVGPLIAALPDLTIVRAAGSGNEVVDILSRLAFDADTVLRPGFAGVVTQVAQLLLLHIVRSYALSTGSALGWLAGMGDPAIARALASVHREPALPWSVTSLARVAGLSRSEFSTR